MLFNSTAFLVFFPVVVCLFFVLPQKFRWAWILAASYYFYGSWRVEYLLLLVATTLVDYTAGRWMDATEEQSKRKRILALAWTIDLGALFVFKYLGFFSRSMHSLGLFTQFPEFQILLPVGISFYTFQSLSYTYEVYRRSIRAEHHLGIFAAYIAFFPQLVAGPIERPGELLPQFRQTKRIDWDRMGDGIKLMLWGFFKKIVIADRLAIYVNSVYNDASSHTGLTLLLATYCFAFQMFCDFSGYTDIARGAARVMGFELMLNFRQPYLARSTREFWTRWHISLSSWFRDYVYIPLGGNRGSHALFYRNLFFTLLVSGIWHGANWTFAIWGALHGCYLILGHATASWRMRLITAVGLKDSRAWGIVQTVITFHMVLLGWVLFRANSVSDAWLILNRIAAIPRYSLTLTAPFQNTRDLIFLALILLLANFHHLWDLRRPNWFRAPVWTTAAIAAQFWFIVTYGVFDNRQFIYFQF